MKASGRRGELRADAREIAQLRHGVNDQPDREVAPFRLPGIKLSASESAEMESIIEKRLTGRTWERAVSGARPTRTICLPGFYGT
jgi:hypothetical protein